MTGNSFKWDPERYQECSSQQFNLGIMAIDRLAPIGRERILEIGSGNGLVTIELARTVPNGSVVGIEISEEMYRKAIINIDVHAISNIQLRNMNALEIDFTEEFDAVFSNSAIHWIEDQRRIYEIIFKSLHPGGRIMIQTGMKERNRLVDTVIALYQSGRYQAHLSKVRLPWKYLTPEEIEEVLSDVGFRKISVESVPFTHKFDDEKQLAGYFESAALVPFLSAFPEDQKDGFKEFFLKSFLKLNNGGTDLSMTRLFISAFRP